MLVLFISQISFSVELSDIVISTFCGDKERKLLSQQIDSTTKKRNKFYATVAKLFYQVHYKSSFILYSKFFFRDIVVGNSKFSRREGKGKIRTSEDVSSILKLYVRDDFHIDFLLVSWNFSYSTWSRDKNNSNKWNS